MGSRETNKKTTVVIQVPDGDVWGQNNVIGGEEKGLDSRYILEEELSGLDMGYDEKRGVKEGGVRRPTHGEYWGWSLFGGRPVVQFGSVKRKVSFGHQGGDVEGQLMYNSRMERRVLGGRDTLGSCQHTYNL